MRIIAGCLGLVFLALLFGACVVDLVDLVQTHKKKEPAAYEGQKMKDKALLFREFTQLFGFLLALFFLIVEKDPPNACAWLLVVISLQLWDLKK